MDDMMWMELRKKTEDSIFWINERLDSKDWSITMVNHWRSRRSAFEATLKRMDEIENYYGG